MTYPAIDPLLSQRASRIKLLALDVDGVLTDGKLYFGNQGEELKTFCTLDGQGIKLLQSQGVVVGLLTARSSVLVANRAVNLGIQHVQQGCESKLTHLLELQGKLGVGMEETAYVGDDLPDLACIRRVGLGIAVSNAHPTLRQHAFCVTTLTGGNGAVREVCDWILQAQGKYHTAIERFL
jgi:3-deoxy-D-manno-octulosonate 8-phosphate phosphatase (KDO 8-P phosphatase)